MSWAQIPSNMSTCVRLVAKLRLVSVTSRYSSIRRLYNPSTLGITDYVATREKYSKNSGDTYSKFRQKMTENVHGDDERYLVFTEDLIQMVHIAEPTDSDLTLLGEMLKKYQKQNAHLRFGTYIFGPVVMRLYHYCNKPEEAVQAYSNPELDGVFDQVASHLVLMDLLFKNGKYQEIVDVYKTMREKQFSFGKHPKSLMVLVFAALYKINTEESYNYMLTLWKEMADSGHEPLRRVTCFAAALALNQNNPHICLEILSVISFQHFVIVRSLKALAYCALGRTSDALSVIATVLIVDMPNAPKHTLPYDVVSAIKESVAKENRKELTFEFNRLEKQLKEYGHISNETLDQVLCTEIDLFIPVDRKKSMIRATLVDSAPTSKRIYPFRPGLQEIA